jgi:hypothetical protein
MRRINICFDLLSQIIQTLHQFHSSPGAVLYTCTDVSDDPYIKASHPAISATSSKVPQSGFNFLRPYA